MLQTLRNAFRQPDLRKKLLFTLLMLLVFRIGGNIPVPGIDRQAFTNLIQRFGQLGALMDIMSGGALNAVSIFAMGITPYINASIIIQLLTVAIPALERYSKEGETGRKKIQRIVRFTTVGIALLQAFGFWSATSSITSGLLPKWIEALMIIGTFTAGTAAIMWIGELINAKGIGNGISLIIFAGILARVPNMIQGLIALAGIWAQTVTIFGAIAFSVLIVAAFLAALALVLYVSLAERRIPVQYSKRVVGRKQYGGHSSYLPIKVNKSGVLPVIFTMSILQIPNLIISFFFANNTSPIVMFFKNFGTNPLYYVLQALLIVGFTFFYSMISFNPVEVSNNLQKNGGFIPGIRPGKPTTAFIANTSKRISWFDGIFLTVVTLLPMILGTVTKTSGLWFGGTAIIIIVGVCLDITNQLESQLVMRHYKGFLD